VHRSNPDRQRRLIGGGVANDPSLAVPKRSGSFFFLLEPVANRGVVTGGGELEPYRKGSCVVTGPSKIGYACPRCKTIMDEVVRIAPLESEPGLIGYECPACSYVTGVLLQSKGSQKRRS
jgi:DNA-directed RNA polymerase subunit RPC12/RpoP